MVPYQLKILNSVAIYKPLDISKSIFCFIAFNCVHGAMLIKFFKYVTIYSPCGIYIIKSVKFNLNHKIIHVYFK
jgi:hypothetical protein